MTRRRAAVLFGLAIIHFAAGLWVSPVFPTWTHRDENAYFDLAQSVSSGEGFRLRAGGEPTIDYAPLYPLMLAGLLRIVPIEVAYAAVWLQAGMMLGVMWLWWRFLIPGLFGVNSSRIGLAFVAIFGSFPVFHAYGRALMSETLALFLVGVAVLLNWSSSLAPRRKGLALGCGAALGCLALTKPVFQFLWVVLPVVAFVTRRKRNLVDELRRAVLVALAFAAIVAPWMARNMSIGGKPTLMLAGSGAFLYFGSTDSPTAEAVEAKYTRAVDPRTSVQEVIAIDDWLLGQAAQSIREAPVPWLVGRLVAVRRLWLTSNISAFGYNTGREELFDPRGVRSVKLVLLAWVAVLLALAIVGVATIKNPRRHAAVLAVPVYFTAISSIGWAGGRYAVPVMPIVFLYSAAGLVWASERIARRVASP